MDSSESYAVKAHKLIKKGHKLNKDCSQISKYERAQGAFELFREAASILKLGKLWNDAANAYLLCVECDKIVNGNESGDLYIQAANMKQHINSAGTLTFDLECIKLLKIAISINIQNNLILNVANIEKRIAQIYENDQQYSLAIEFYKKAAQNSLLKQKRIGFYNYCQGKIVEIGIYKDVVDYVELITILESIAQRQFQNKLTIPQVKDQYFKSILLFLANNDIVGARKSMQKYVGKDPSFFQTRQQKFCDVLIKSSQQRNLKLFQEECFKFNEAIPLNKWKTTILMTIKAHISQTQQFQMVLNNSNQIESDIQCNGNQGELGI